MVARDHKDGNLLKEAEVAVFLNISVLTLRRWRWAQRGPTYVKIGTSVRYRPEDIDTFIQGAQRAPRHDENVR